MRAIRNRDGRAVSLLLSVASMVCISAPLQATERYYTGPCGGEWSSFSNWHTNPDGTGSPGVPAAGDLAYLLRPSNCTVNFSIPFPSEELSSISIDGSAGAEVTLNQTVNSLWSDGEVIGSAGKGKLIHSGGENLGGEVVLGSQAGGIGTYQLSGTATLSAFSERIGYQGSGVFTHLGGTNAASNLLYVGSESGSHGSYVMSGGSVTAGTLIVGASGTGVFLQQSGSVTASLALAEQPGSTGTYTLGAGASLNTNNTSIGTNDIGIFRNQGGVHKDESTIFLGNAESGNGSYALSAGSLDANLLVVGEFGTGDFSHTGGNVSANQITIASHVGSSGKYTLGAGSLTSQFLYVGNQGVGQFKQQGGSTTVTGTLFIQPEEGSSGTYDLSNGTLISTDTVNDGTFNQTGGSVNLGTVSGSGTISVAAGKTLRAKYIRQETVSVLGTVAIDPSASSTETSIINHLQIAGATNAWTSTFDLGNNMLVIRGSTLATVRNQIKYGLANGRGLISTSNLGGGILGAIVNKNSSGQTIYSSFGDASDLLPSDILVRYTLRGDINLDGCVGISDFIDLASHFNEAAPVDSNPWAKGDTNYDELVSIADFIDLASNFNRCLPNPFPEQAPSAVPEPSSLAGGMLILMVVGGWGSGRRRR